MANHHRGHGAVHHNSLFDLLAWPVAALSILTWPVMPWFDALWTHLPTPTAVYMMISAGFMLFQMFDKLGWIERIKRKPPEDR